MKGGKQLPVYYVSKRLIEAELRYPEVEKLALALVISTRKLRHYFLAHPIVVLTGYPIKTILRRPEVSGRLVKWAIELTQYDITYQPRTAIKGQALADFIAEFTFPTREDRDQTEAPPSWTLFVDGASNEGGAGAGLMLVSPEMHRISCAVRFAFAASNNEAEYEALLAGLRLAKELQVESIQIFSD